MEEITLQGVAHQIYRSTGRTDVEFINPATGLKHRLWLLKIEIEPRNRHIATKWRLEQWAGDVKIKEETLPVVTTTEEDYLSFEASILGELTKKSAINGVFRFVLGNTYSVYHPDTAELLTEQPVAWPEPLNE